MGPFLRFFRRKVQRRTHLGGIGISPLEWKRAALVRFHRMNAAAVVVRQIRARLVRTALEDKSLPVRRNLGFPIDELLLGHSEERGNALNPTFLIIGKLEKVSTGS